VRTAPSRDPEPRPDARGARAPPPAPPRPPPRPRRAPAPGPLPPHGPAGAPGRARAPPLAPSPLPRAAGHPAPARPAPAPARRLQDAERHARALVIIAELCERAVYVDRLIVASLAQERDHALRLPERVGAHDMCPLGKLPHRLQQLSNLVRCLRMREDRQGERGFSDENIAGNRFERRASGIPAALVVARGHD